jgi:hypothetical protein
VLHTKFNYQYFGQNMLKVVVFYERYRQIQRHILGWFGWLLLGYCFTPTDTKAYWSHYTDTSEPVDGNGAQNMITVQSGFEPVTC